MKPSFQKARWELNVWQRDWKIQSYVYRRVFIKHMKMPVFNLSFEQQVQ